MGKEKDVDNEDGDGKGEGEGEESNIYDPIGFGEFGRYMRNKVAKLQVQDEDAISDDERSNVFDKCSIYINGYTQPPQAELKHLIVAGGGHYVQYLSRKGTITHIIASNLTPAKRIEFKDYKVVLPEWITDSVQKGILQDWKHYKLGTGERDSAGDIRDGAIEEGWGKSAQRGMTQFFQPTSLNRISQTGQPETKTKCKRPSGVLPPPNNPLETPIPKRRKLHSSLSSGNVENVVTPATPSEVVALTEEDDTSPSRQIIPRVIDFPPNLPAKTEVSNLQPASSEGSLSILDVGSSSGETITPSKPSSGPPESDPHTSGEQVPSHNTEEGHGYFPANVSKGQQREAALLQDPEWRLQNTSANPTGFLTGYFESSRLHHLSTWKAELKHYVAGLLKDAKEKEESGDGTNTTLNIDAVAQKQMGKKRAKLTGTEEDGRFIAHIDLDCFFVSAGLLSNPKLRGMPICVCHAKGAHAGSTSEISSCSYEARKCGVRNGITLGRARELCPQLKTIPYDFPLYDRISRNFYQILLDCSKIIQVQSVDEAFLDIGAALKEKMVDQHEPIQESHVLDFVNNIRKNIVAETGCPCSIGVGANPLLARLATRRAKPDGAFWLRMSESEHKEWLGNCAVDDLPGVGWQMESKLKDQVGVTTIGDIIGISKDRLRKAIGPVNAETLRNYASGIDARELEGPGETMRQSVSTEVNWGIRFQTDDETQAFMIKVAEETSRRLNQIGLVGRQLTLKIMKRAKGADVAPPKHLGHGQCDTFTKTVDLLAPGGTATSDATLISETSIKLLKAFKFDCKELRGIGIQIHKLESASTATSSQTILDFKRGKPNQKKSKDVKSGGHFFVVEASNKPVDPIPPSNDLTEELLEPPKPRPTKKKAIAKVPAGTYAPANFDEVDPEVFASLPLEVQAELKASWAYTAIPVDPNSKPAVGDKKKTKSNNNNKKVKNAGAAAAAGQTTLIDDGKNTLALQVLRKPDRPLPNTPNSVQEDELAILSIDIEFFRNMPRELQLEILTQQREANKEAYRNYSRQLSKSSKLKTSSSSSEKPSSSSLSFSLPKEISLCGEKDLDTIRDLFDDWFEDGEKPPMMEDVKVWENYLMACLDLSRGRGRDWEKVSGIMNWWLYRLKTSSSSSSDSDFNSIHPLWHEEARSIAKRLDDLAEDCLGATLRLEDKVKKVVGIS